MFNFYFNWLQKDNPTGLVDRFPELKNNYETSVPGLYCIGDLTGIPLIKLAAESGYAIIERFAADDTFMEQCRNNQDGLYDVIIAGAGPAGVAASIRAGELGLSNCVFESSRMFSTISNFPSGKPIYVTPEEPPMRSALMFNNGTKETLLNELAEAIHGKDVPVREGVMVKSITRNGNGFIVETSSGRFEARRVIVAIGKSGNARTLNIPGENLTKVFNRLIDPAEYRNKNILVVGGGDSAVEAAVALAEKGNRVTLSYRKALLSRPKEQNLHAFTTHVAKGTIAPLFESDVVEIRDDSVIVRSAKGEITIPNDMVFTLIGTEIPITFFKRSGIRIQGERHFADWMKIAGLLLFASILYFGKKAPATPLSDISGIFNILSMLQGKNWYQTVNALFAWGSLLLFVPVMVYIIAHYIRNSQRYFSNAWDIFKYSYYFAIALLIAWLFVSYKALLQKPLFGDMGAWYTIIYSLTIVIFGFRRIAVKPTGYIKRQTLALMLIQILPLCILPMFIFPYMGKHDLLGDWIMTNVFPDGSYWRAYGLILAWPLFIHNLATGLPTMFWLIMGIVQTFVIIPYIVYRWGKGAYCGWICSCGALAETLGDEYRTLAPHGPYAKKWENAGQVVLWFAVAVTLCALLAGAKGNPVASLALNLYNITVDIVFAGVLGVGVYFSMSGRIWCRFLCPLAALMHIYARFSVYRIFSIKKRCISCNICTRVCHMGIDVLGYANKGIPMDDVECVRCSACVIYCPMDVLSFGSINSVDPENTRNALSQGGGARPV